VTRFADPGTLCSWAGLTPRHRESDATVHRGPITKQGSRLVRWAAIEAIQLTRAGTKLSTDKARIIQQRGRNIGKVAAARKLLTLVYYGLRDGHIRSLAAARGLVSRLARSQRAWSCCVMTPYPAWSPP
jgi:hypothetical protein